MTMIDITLHLPEELVNRAEAAGVLSDERIAALLEREIERQVHAERFAQTLSQLRAVEPPLTEADVAEEIRQYRAEKSSHRKNA